MSSEDDLGRRKNRIDALATRAAQLELQVSRLQGLAANYQERLAKLEAMHHTHEATGTGHYASGVEE